MAKRLSAASPGLQVVYLAPHAECEIREDGLIGSEAIVAQRPVAPRELARAIRRALARAASPGRPSQCRDVILSDALPEHEPESRPDSHGATPSLPHRKTPAPDAHRALGKTADL